MVEFCDNVLFFPIAQLQFIFFSPCVVTMSAYERSDVSFKSIKKLKFSRGGLVFASSHISVHITIILS